MWISINDNDGEELEIIVASAFDDQMCRLARIHFVHEEDGR